MLKEFYWAFILAKIIGDKINDGGTVEPETNF